MDWLTYPKTENLYVRDEDTHKLIRGKIRIPEHSLIRRWLVLEKLDGMNMRLCLNMVDATFDVRGRSDNANLQGDLIDACKALIERDDAFKNPQLCLPGHPELPRMSRQLHAYIDEATGAKASRIVLFGEGIGPKIQGNPHGLEAREFRLFDVAQSRGDRWFFWPWEQVASLAGVFDIPLARNFGYFNDLKMLTDWVKLYLHGQNVEGVIGRTDPYLTDQYGNLVKFKLKGKDL